MGLVLVPLHNDAHDAEEGQEGKNMRVKENMMGKCDRTINLLIICPHV